MKSSIIIDYSTYFIDWFKLQFYNLGDKCVYKTNSYSESNYSNNHGKA